jgi:hypothetical protein
MNINKLILAALLLAPLSLNASNSVSDLYLAQRCRELWVQLIARVDQEQVLSCKNKIEIAGNYFEKTVNELFAGHHDLSKIILKQGIDVLASTSSERCDLADELSLFKNDFQELYSSIE